MLKEMTDWHMYLDGYFDHDKGMVTVAMLTPLGCFWLEIPVNEWRKWLVEEMEKVKPTPVPTVFRQAFREYLD